MTLTKRTYSCAPATTDDDLICYCRNGYWILEGVVPDEINRRAMDYLDAHPISEPSEILKEDWFIENVICNPEAAGAVRSLLGDNFAFPVLMSNHRGTNRADNPRHSLILFFQRWRGKGFNDSYRYMPPAMRAQMSLAERKLWGLEAGVPPNTHFRGMSQEQIEAPTPEEQAVLNIAPY